MGKVFSKNSIYTSAHTSTPNFKSSIENTAADLDFNDLSSNLTRRALRSEVPNIQSEVPNIQSEVPKVLCGIMKKLI